MKEEKNKWINAIANLIKLTQNGTVKWRSQDPSDLLNIKDDQIVEVVFTAKYKNYNLRLYNRKYKVAHDPAAYFDPLKRYKEGTWVPEVVLNFTDMHGHPVYTYPQSSILTDLLNTVQYQVAGIQGFLDEFWEDE